MSTKEFEDSLDAVTVTHAPARFSSTLAVVAALLAVVTTLFGWTVAFLIGLFGLGGVAAGLFVLDSQGFATAGVGVVFVAVVLAGLQGNPPMFVIVGALATVLAFDYSSNAFSVGAQLSNQAETQRGELVHAAASFVYGSIALFLAYGVYFVAGSGYPAAALVFVLLAGILLAWAIRT